MIKKEDYLIYKCVDCQNIQEIKTSVNDYSCNNCGYSGAPIVLMDSDKARADINNLISLLKSGKESNSLFSKQGDLKLKIDQPEIPTLNL